MSVRWLPRGTTPKLLMAGLLGLVVFEGGLLSWQLLRQQTKPDFARLYQRSATPAQVMPVVLIPGVFGSRLLDPDSGEELWPGNVWRVAFSDYADLALQANAAGDQALPSRLVPSGIAEQTLQQDYYRPILQTLTQYGGYQRMTPGTPVQDRQERRLYVFAYDWRLDIVDNVRALHALVQAIQTDYGNPQQQVDIVAHSMGGLIARYYLRHGSEDVLNGQAMHVTMAGADTVNKLILLGTPNFGSVGSLHAFISGQRVGGRSLSPLTLATFPSGYQLFPHPLNTWLLDTQGQAVNADVFSPLTWRQFGWSVYEPAAASQADAPQRQHFFEQQLERARRLAWMLAIPEPVSKVRYIVFGGGCHNTPSRMVLERVSGLGMVRLNPSDIAHPLKDVDYEALMTEPGDGRVTKPSLLARETLDPSAPYHEDSYFPLAYSFFLCDQHADLTSNVHFQDNLLHTLLSPRDDVQVPLKRKGAASQPLAKP